MQTSDKVLLRKRALVETVNDELKKHLSDSTYKTQKR